jgi:hypothetical protein
MLEFPYFPIPQFKLSDSCAFKAHSTGSSVNGSSATVFYLWLLSALFPG